VDFFVENLDMKALGFTKAALAPHRPASI